MGKYQKLNFLFIQGNNQQVPVKNEVDSFETMKAADTKLSSVKKTQRASPEDACSEKQDTPSAEVCIPHSLSYSEEHSTRCTDTLHADRTDAFDKYASFSVDASKGLM